MPMLNHKLDPINVRRAPKLVNAVFSGTGISCVSFHVALRPDKHNSTQVLCELSDGTLHTCLVRPQPEGPVDMYITDNEIGMFASCLRGICVANNGN